MDFTRKDTKRLLWLMDHCFYPTHTNRNGKKGYRFGVLPYRKTIRQAIDDAMKESKGR